MSLGQETGQTLEEMRKEAKKLIDIISELDFDSLSDKELHFFEDMRNKLIFPKFSISGKQIFWLRDIKDRLL